MSRVFDIGRLPPEHRSEAWRSGACRLIHPMLVRVDEYPAHGRVVATDELGIRTIRVRGGSSTVERPRRLIGENEPGLLQLTLMLAGRLELEQGGTGGEALAGDLTWYAARQPYRLRAHGSFDLIHVLLPEDSIALVRDVLVPTPATPVPRDATATPLVASFLQGLVASQAASGAGVFPGSLETALLGLLAAFPCRTTELLPKVDRREAWFNSAVAFVRAHLDEPDLAPRRIAAALPVSVRSLHALFAQRETSVVAFIREERLLAAARDLLDPAQAQRSVGDIGLSRGFVSSSHFNRSFSERFGEAPGRYRRTRHP